MLVGDDESLEAGVLPALQQYNLEQFTVAEVPDAGHTVRRAHSVLTTRTHLHYCVMYSVDCQLNSTNSRRGRSFS
jgi:hypothetical protein